MSDYSEDDGSDFYDYNSDEPVVEEDNDSDYDLSIQSSKKGKQKSTAIDARSLSIEALQEMINGDINRVASITGLPPSISLVLLQHFRWNEDQEALFDCPICCDSVPIKDGTFRLRCSHQFCKECWREYVVAKVKDEGQCFFKCMQDGCPTTVDNVSIERIAPGTVASRYQTLVQQSYVQATSRLRFCPHAGCSETLFCPAGYSSSTITDGVPIVRCGEGHEFCFGCGNDTNHRPLLCKFVQVWNKRLPEVHNNIEKAGGCNRIVCRHCNHEFCWMCMKVWSVHGYSNTTCNAFVEPEPTAESSEARQNLERWLFYFDRFTNHELSADLDKALLERTEERMREVQENSEMSWIEAKFMEKAVDELTKCRLTLKCKGNDKEIFEDLQADLEKAVEQLSQMLGEEIQAETVKELRQRMIDKTVYVRRRHEIMLKDTEEGIKQNDGSWRAGLLRVWCSCRPLYLEAVSAHAGNMCLNELLAFLSRFVAVEA
ncbi:hypothetical protein BC629DRAFT_1463549 [Irpex lacteus]|nr:hypothetical protein BC629DRAFT_1463549 [Irpex lacteus]